MAGATTRDRNAQRLKCDRKKRLRQSLERLAQRFHFRLARRTEQLPPSIGVVLIVQVNGWNGESLVPLLRSVGYTARIAEDGDAALEILKDAHPLAIIVGGAANLNLYCTLRRAARIPILALVPESDRDRALSAFAVGVDDYQSSPIGSREIVTRVGALLRSIHRKSPSIQTSL